VHKYQHADADHHKYLFQISLGPLNVIRTWPIYYVNGYEFHIEDRRKGLITFNSGVCVTGTIEGSIVYDYYGILKEVVELVYPKEPTKKCLMFRLFSCDWFDPTINHGMRVQKEFGFVGRGWIPYQGSMNNPSYTRMSKFKLDK